MSKEPEVALPIKERKTNYLKLEKYWKIPPLTIGAKDGSKRKLILEHRIGREAFTEDELFTQLGMEKELLKHTIQMEKNFSDSKVKQFYANAAHAKYMARLRHWLGAYRAHLCRMYIGQRIKPIMRPIPIEDPKHPGQIRKEWGIWGFIDVDTLSPIIGDLDDITLAIESANANIKKMVDEYKENQAIARKALTLPSVNKDLMNRLNMVASGTLEKVHLIERITGETEEKK
jgi:hypothetical protein